MSSAHLTTNPADVREGLKEALDFMEANRCKKVSDPHLPLTSRQSTRHVSAFEDASGSMHQAILGKAASPFGGVSQGLPTDFEFVAGRAAHGATHKGDLVLVVTDGYAPEITGLDPDKWIWRVMPGGTI